MGLRFRKTISVLPGVRLNISKSGVSASIGGKGVTLNVGRKGARGTVGLPGTGLSYSQRFPRPKARGERGEASSSLLGKVVGWLSGPRS